MKFRTYEEFVNGAVQINWLDPNEPRTKKEEVEVLTKLWNFSVYQEEKEERLAEEREDEEEELGEYF